MKLNTKQLIDAMRALNGKLEESGQYGEVLVFGGAAMCLAYKARSSTKDIDAIFEPKDIIYKLASEIANDQSLPEDWLNDGVKGFVNANAKKSEAELFTFSHLKVNVVGAEYLLSMKLLSSRMDSSLDKDDILFLMRKLNIDSFDKADKVIKDNFPEKYIPPKVQYVIEDCINELNEELER